MRLPRIQSFEFNERPEVPAFLRDTIVESLSRTLDWGRIFDGVVPALQHFLRRAQVEEILDLGAGAGGPAQVLLRACQRHADDPPKIWLTDLFPRPAIWAPIKARTNGAIDYVEVPVDATAVPAPWRTGRARLLINILHHLPPERARRVFEDAARSEAPIFVTEGFGRNPLQFLNFAPVGLLSLALNPLLTPKDRRAKAAATYGAPLLMAAACVWDGLVSTMRVYTPRELRAMVRDLPGDYRWTSGTFRYRPYGTGTYFYGIPASARS